MKLEFGHPETKKLAAADQRRERKIRDVMADMVSHPDFKCTPCTCGKQAWERDTGDWQCNVKAMFHAGLRHHPGELLIEAAKRVYGGGK